MHVRSVVLLLFLSVLSAQEMIFIDAVNMEKIDNLKSSTDKIQRIYIIRHGQSIYNVPNEKGIRYIAGTSNWLPLTNEGEKQAKETGQAIKKKIPKDTDIVICSSCAVRAKDTATYIFEVLKDHCNIERGVIDPRLQERSRGIWEGKPKDSHFQEQDKLFKGLSEKEQWYSPSLPSAESYCDASDRALLALNDIIDLYPEKTIFIVAHNGIMKALSIRFMEIELSDDPNTNLPPIRYKNCGMMLVENKIPQALQR